MLLTIIVPIYNVELYLERCLNSLPINNDVQIVLVDDGSPDRCPEIAEQYTKKNPNAMVIHQKNGGLSNARNNGIKKSVGKYLFFVDSDDYIEIESIEDVLEILDNNDSDVVSINSFVVNGLTFEQMNCLELDNVDGTSFLSKQLLNKSFKVAVWNYLFKRDFLVKNNFVFKEGIAQEDTEWTPRVLVKANNVKNLSLIQYFYCIRENSISTQKNLSKNMRDLVSTINYLDDFFSANQFIRIRRMIMDYLINNYLSVFAQDIFYKRKDSFLLRGGYVYKNSFFLKTKLKAFVYCLSKRLYYVTSNKMKK